MVTCDLPVSFDLSWNWLADPDLASPGRVDILLGVEVFVPAVWLIPNEAWMGFGRMLNRHPSCIR